MVEAARFRFAELFVALPHVVAPRAAYKAAPKQSADLSALLM